MFCLGLPSQSSVSVSSPPSSAGCSSSFRKRPPSLPRFLLSVQLCASILRVTWTGGGQPEDSCVLSPRGTCNTPGCSAAPRPAQTLQIIRDPHSQERPCCPPSLLRHNSGHPFPPFLPSGLPCSHPRHLRRTVLLTRLRPSAYGSPRLRPLARPSSTLRFLAHHPGPRTPHSVPHVLRSHNLVSGSESPRH